MKIFNYFDVFISTQRKLRGIRPPGQKLQERIPISWISTNFYLLGISKFKSLNRLLILNVLNGIMNLDIQNRAILVCFWRPMIWWQNMVFLVYRISLIESNNYFIIFFLSFLDLDADEALTWDEYSSIKSESVLVRHSDLKKRKEEFTLYIDKNKDGRLDKREILVSRYRSYVPTRFSHFLHISMNGIVLLAGIFRSSKSEACSLRSSFTGWISGYQ